MALILPSLSATAEVSVGGFTAATVTASSTLFGARDRYAPWRTIDRDAKTAWCEGSKGDGVGEWLSLRFDKPIKADRIALLLGYHKSNRLFASNAVPTVLRVEADDRVSTVKLAATRRTQHVRLPTSTFARLKITIAGVRRGSRHPDACISSLDLLFRGRKLAVATPAEVAARARLRQDLVAIKRAFDDCNTGLLQRHLKLPLRFTPVVNDPDGSSPAPTLTLTRLKDLLFICRKGRNPFARTHEEIQRPTLGTFDDLTVQELRFPGADLLDITGQGWSLLWTTTRWVVTRIY